MATTEKAWPAGRLPIRVTTGPTRFAIALFVAGLEAVSADEAGPAGEG
ncbi:MAG: hypothetical protein QM638_00415 [Nocardioides sp.]